jgi:cyclic pyranopterin phosphate synthase
MSHDEAKPARLTHLDEAGAARMVDVSGKGVTLREASASAAVHMTPGVLDALMEGTLPKGDALATARIAGIQAAKRTAEWIPLCHVLPLHWVQIDFERSGRDELRIACTARTTARTGVEMEALVGASAAALTVYDMAKALDKSMVIGPIQLERKTGGKSGSYRRGD